MTSVGECITWCPEGVIEETGGKAFINDERSIGCGECLAVCRFEQNGRNLGTASYPEHDALIQLRYAAKVGLGQLEYELIKVE